jgi:hypothetical protein
VNTVDQGFLNCFNRYFLIPGQAKVIEGGAGPATFGER